MGIFGMIKDAIWGHQADAPVQAAPSTTATPQMNTPSDPTVAAPAAAATPTPAAPKQDATTILEQKAAQKSEHLNWRTSIVDLMKVLDLDPSMSNRVELAHEFGYTGDVNDSATMNVWLHQKVMESLAT